MLAVQDSNVPKPASISINGRPAVKFDRQWFDDINTAIKYQWDSGLSGEYSKEVKSITADGDKWEVTYE
jgi:hypothetical protein